MAIHRDKAVRIGFVSCSKTKSLYRKPAAALYTSPLFRKSLLSAIDRSDRVYILSAKHGLLECGDFIDPYDTTLKTMKRVDRFAWGEKTGAQLDGVLSAGDTAVLLCGEEYLAPLRPDLDRLNVKIETPLGALSLGSRLSLLGILNQEIETVSSSIRFFSIMSHVWAAQSGGRLIKETNGRQKWPARGVYFILSPDHSQSRGRMPRIVRVGTHAVSQGSRTTLWDRLSTHRGTTAGGGSHRSSIFRLHVGRAWTRFAHEESWPDSWSRGQSAPHDVRLGEELLEQQVSQLIGAMRVLWLDVDDEPGPNSERAYIERNAIGLLSRLELVKMRAEPDWLGSFSPNWRITTSGLWNLNHVFRRPDPDFIERLTAVAERTIGQAISHSTKIGKMDRKRSQLSFLGETEE